ncbi:MAG: hypothetical protein Q8R30_05795 [bacterium]|nr:hypothetical protein [bacterium]MDZ4260490.1 hypothetical protein [Candidatus Sungbacteria bacterium]
MRTTIAAAIIFSLIGVFSATAQERAQEPIKTAVLEPAVSAPAITALSPLFGKWKGTWEGGQWAYGKMEVEFQASDGDRMTGRVRATYANATTCSEGWESLTGVKTGEKVSLRYNLGGRCGNVVLDLTVDAKKDNQLVGTYVSEAGFGTIRLKKQ